MQAMLINPNLARKHISFIVNSISELQIFVLQVRILFYFLYLFLYILHRNIL